PLEMPTHVPRTHAGGNGGVLLRDGGFTCTTVRSVGSSHEGGADERTQDERRGKGGRRQSRNGPLLRAAWPAPEAAAYARRLPHFWNRRRTPAALHQACPRPRLLAEGDQGATGAPHGCSHRFADAIARAQGEWEAQQLARIDAAAEAKPECWTAAAWQLERFDRATYGRREQVGLSGMVTLAELRGLMLGVVHR